MKRILSAVRRAVDDYGMIEDGDRIAVGVSAGKDSLTLVAALAALRRFYPKRFELGAVTVDMGFEPPCDFSAVREFCEGLDVPYHVVPTEIAKIVFDVRKEKNPCGLCAKMRRGALHDECVRLGYGKLALGHHFDDVIETILMGMLYGAQVQTMMPKLHSIHFEGMELIRPLYLIREDDIKAWRDANELHFIQCACHFTDTCTTCSNQETRSKRQEIKDLIRTLKQRNPDVEAHIFRSVENVNLDTVIGWKTGGKKYSFLDRYDEEA